MLGIDQKHIDVVKEGMRRVVHEESGTAHHPGMQMYRT